MDKRIEDILNGPNVLILGFGREGRSTLKFFENCCPDINITIADQNEKSYDEEIKHRGINFVTGEFYLEDIDQYDAIIKSPGIPRSQLASRTDASKIFSQTEIFLSLFRDQTIGVTGTKGKSTTTSLIFQILLNANKKAILLGNIGVPPLDLALELDSDSIVVFEMSSHQLDDVSISPHIAVFLNLFEEHLDHYDSFEDYKKAKFNIFKYQQREDFLIVNSENQEVFNSKELSGASAKKIWFPKPDTNYNGAELGPNGEIICNHEGINSIIQCNNRKSLPGSHNLLNIMAAVCVAKVLNIEDTIIEKTVNKFENLRHRLEYLGKFKGIYFYNDSIATIPEATIAALKTLEKVDTLILGGKDRGINYQVLINFLSENTVSNIIFMGDAGKRMRQMFKEYPKVTHQTFFIEKFTEIADILKQNANEKDICLLSPAASSYDQFSSFEERGDAFKKIAENL